MRIGSNHDLEATASNFTVLSPLIIQAMLVKAHHLVSTVNPKGAELHSND